MKIKKISQRNLFKYIIYRFPLSLIVIVSLFFLFGCASNTIFQSTNPDILDSTQFEVIAETINDDTPYAESASGTSIIDNMVSQAEYFCALEKYSQSDSILKEVITLLEESYTDSSSLENQDTYNKYFNTVLGIYSELIPSEYISEEITLLVDKRRLLESIDLIVLSDSDTILQAIRKSLGETKFDVPMAYNERVQKACMFYLRNNRSTIEKWLSRSALYVPTMKKMFADSSLPLDLVYLPLIESGFNPKAYSRAHASGMWQFIPSTGNLFGLRNNYWLDERRDPLKATVSAIRYLKKLHKEFGHWHLALGAYNCGENGMRRAISKAGVSDYWKLKLPKETMNYVPLYLASLIIIKNPERFGFKPSVSSTTLGADTVALSDCIDMNEIAKGIGIDKEALYKMNPHILHWCTPPDMTDVRLYLPEGTALTFKEFYSNIPDDKKVKWYRYRISGGDNLITIAKKFKVSLEAIKNVNRMKNNRIIAGRYLFIPIPVHGNIPPEKDIPKTKVTKTQVSQSVPTGSSTKYKVKKGDTIWEIADIFGVNVNDICQWNSITQQHIIKANDILTIYPDKSTPKDEFFGPLVEYEVKKGDTPYSVATKFNMTLQDLVKVNELDASQPTLYIGDVVRVSAVKPTVKQSVVQKASIQNDNNAIRYKVVKGDNLFRIAKIFDTSVAAIQSVNNLDETSSIMVGDILFIPSSKNGTPLIVNEDANDLVLYEVKRGDNLWRIAVSFGIPVEKLYAINNLTPDSVLMPGDVIKVTKAEDM